ncbi:MAG: magnesium transporter [Rubellimicrobium sp.]|nr:magnesium transporter [Rubellimicrobium sp.]
MADGDEIDADGDEVFGLPAATLAEVRAALDDGDGPRLAGLTDPLHPADLADLVEHLSPRERRDLVAQVPGLIDGDVLSELTEGLRDEVVALLAPGELAQAVQELDSDDVVDLVETLDEEAQESVLAALAAPERAQVEKALAYPEGSAGRLMQVEVVRAPEHWTVADATIHLRQSAALPDQFYHVVLVDPRMKPVGYCTLGRILSSPGATRLRDITEDSFRPFHVEDDEEEVARAFNRYHLISAPVVDGNDRLVGVITIDDAVRILEEEHEEDMLSLGGVAGESGISARTGEILRGRAPWLGVNLVSAVLASMVIGLFEGALQQIVALAVLMPIVASMGGAAGTQGLTVAVRALATRDLTVGNARRVIMRELVVGLLNGLVFAVVIGLVSWWRFDNAMLGLVIGLAMVLNLVAAAGAGVLIPIALDRLRVDPAIASGPFVTTVTDIVGFFAFLGLAAVILL